MEPYLNFRLSILIVTFNNVSEIKDLLDDLSTHFPGGPVVVIDNASHDGTPELIARDFPNVNLVRNSQNVGYARAVNQGSRLCTTPYIFLLNPDIHITDPSVFSEALRCLENDPNIAACAPLQFQKTVSGQPHLNFTWSYYGRHAFRLFLAYKYKRQVIEDYPIRVSFLNAGCLFLRKRIFEGVGRFNEKYFLYGEEPDLFLKFKRYGYECRLLPAVSVFHYRERSIQKVKPLKLVKFKLAGMWNILDAIVRGWTDILKDRLQKQIALSNINSPKQ